MSKLRWSNIPIPEGHVIALVLGIALHLWKPFGITQTTWLIYLLAGPLLLMGILLAAWAVTMVNAIDISKPAMIITTGPYAFSRNPMYVAWMLIYLGVALIMNTAWLTMLLPILILFTHYFVIRQEEHQLEKLFGEPYRQYCARVRRYL